MPTLTEWKASKTATLREEVKKSMIDTEQPITEHFLFTAAELEEMHEEVLIEQFVELHEDWEEVSLDEDELEEWEIYHKERESAPEPYNPQFEGRNMTFCCTTCQTKWHERIDKLTQLKVEVQANLETLYPECTVKYTGGNYGDGTVDFELTVPGLKYKITYESNHPNTMLVSDCDIEAWKTYKESKINNV